VLVIHFGTPCPKMTALGDNLFVPRFALRPWRYADISLARCRLRTTPSNGLTACRMRVHMASAAPGPRGPCGPRRPLRHSGHTHAPTPTGDYAPSLRSPWRAAVDYAGQTVEVVDRGTGEIRSAQIFVAVLGAWTQQLPDWIGAHVRAFAFFGGVSELLVPDNLRSGVCKAHRYEPDLNPTYAELASHYAVAVLPARVRKPRDKAKAEAGVLLVERWILAALRDRTFFSLAELNRAIARLLEGLNSRPFKKLPGSRRELFEQLERSALRPLPAQPYAFAEWKKVRVNIDYHVEVEGHYYSVPYQLVGKTLEARYSERTVECFHKGQRVASHPRSHLKGRHTTVPEHMPTSHRSYAEWTPQRLIGWAAKTGPATASMVQGILERRAHPQQGFRSALGIMRLGKRFGEERLEAACRRALTLGAYSYKSIESILRQGLDRKAFPEQQDLDLALAHENIRGSDYYH